MKTNNNKNKCAICKGTKKSGTTTFTVDYKEGVIIVRNVPALICTQCGEEWLSSTTMNHIESLVNEAKKRKAQLELISI